MERYPLISSKNLPAYGVVMGSWLAVSAALAGVLRWLSDSSIPWWTALGFAAAAAMLGMMIMFVASAVNLRKLRPGFERLARGEQDPAIPPVWCPVLTMATRSALELHEKLDAKGIAAQEQT